jgi:GR25 family glycosyltransferase involved in LPS biosynthesis
MTSKFDGFAPVYVINLEDRADRRSYISSHFAEYGVIDYEFFPAYDGRSLDGLYEMSGPDVGCTTSHILAIKSWYESSDTEYAIICEDDISLENSKYWQWSWIDIVSSLPKSLDILHLSTCAFHVHTPDQISLEKRNRDDTGLLTSCYLISRSGAKSVLTSALDAHGGLNIDFNDKNNIADHKIIYGNVKNYYMLPLFNQTMKYGSDLDKSIQYDRFHNMNAEHTAWLWKYNVKSIDQIINI